MNSLIKGNQTKATIQKIFSDEYCAIKGELSLANYAKKPLDNQDQKEVMKAMSSKLGIDNEVCLTVSEIMRKDGWSKKLALAAIENAIRTYEYGTKTIPPAKILNFVKVKFYNYDYLINKYGNISGFKAVKIKGESNTKLNGDIKQEIPYWVNFNDFNEYIMIEWEKYARDNQKSK